MISIATRLQGQHSRTAFTMDDNSVHVPVLPYEVTSIIHSLLASDSQGSIHEYYATLSTLRRVSSTWNAIITGMASLWSSIDTDQPEPLLRVCLERSQSCGLDVNLHYDHPFAVFDGRPNRLASLLVPHAHRIIRLAVKFPHYFTSQVLPAQLKQLLATPKPSLRILQLDGETDPESAALLTDQPLPRLQRLRITHTRVDWSLLAQVAPGLRHLDVDSACALDDLHFALGTFKQLETVKAGHIGRGRPGDPEAPPVAGPWHLSLLRELRLAQLHPRDICAVLAAIQQPDGIRLDLECSTSGSFTAYGAKFFGQLFSELIMEPLDKAGGDLPVEIWLKETFGEEGSSVGAGGGGGGGDGGRSKRELQEYVEFAAPGVRLTMDLSRGERWSDLWRRINLDTKPRDIKLRLDLLPSHLLHTIPRRVGQLGLRVTEVDVARAADYTHSGQLAEFLLDWVMYARPGHPVSTQRPFPALQKLMLRDLENAPADKVVEILEVLAKSLERRNQPEPIVPQPTPMEARPIACLHLIGASVDLPLLARLRAAVSEVRVDLPWYVSHLNFDDGGGPGG